MPLQVISKLQTSNVWFSVLSCFFQHSGNFAQNSKEINRIPNVRLAVGFQLAGAQGMTSRLLGMDGLSGHSVSMGVSLLLWLGPSQIGWVSLLVVLYQAHQQWGFPHDVPKEGPKRLVLTWWVSFQFSFQSPLFFFFFFVFYMKSQKRPKATQVLRRLSTPWAPSPRTLRRATTTSPAPSGPPTSGPWGASPRAAEPTFFCVLVVCSSFWGLICTLFGV